MHVGARCSLRSGKGSLRASLQRCWVSHLAGAGEPQRWCRASAASCASSGGPGAAAAPVLPLRLGAGLCRRLLAGRFEGLASAELVFSSRAALLAHWPSSRQERGPRRRRLPFPHAGGRWGCWFGRLLGLCCISRLPTDSWDGATVTVAGAYREGRRSPSRKGCFPGRTGCSFFPSSLKEGILHRFTRCQKCNANQKMACNFLVPQQVRRGCCLE